MRISYNAPVILTYTLLATLVLAADQFVGHLTADYFTVFARFDSAAAIDYVRLFSHVIGHSDWTHLMGNFSFILLIGPILEEKYGTVAILLMFLVTALLTGLLNIFFFSTGLMGGSGIVFMLILLSSFANFRSGQIPLTFILIVALFLTKEIINAFAFDNISQFAHIIGGICGSIFGLIFTKERN